MANPKYDRRSSAQPRQQHTTEYKQRYADADDVETIVQVAPAPAPATRTRPRTEIPARASGLRRAATAAPTTTGEPFRSFPPIPRPSIDDEGQNTAIDLGIVDADTRSPSSARRYTQRQPVPVSMPYETHYAADQRTRRSHGLFALAQAHPFVGVGLGMLVAVSLYAAGTSAISWGNGVMQRWNYGPTPTFQVNQAVGHNGDSAQHPSHFIATDDGGRIEVFEVSPDGTRSQFYSFDTLSNVGNDVPPVTLSFIVDQQSGRVDMEIHIQGMDTPLVCVNDGSKFDPPTIG